MNNAKKTPILTETEYLIVGSGLAALPLAKRLADQGRDVLVTEAGTCPGYEISRYYRPWSKESLKNSVIADKWFPDAYCRELSELGETPLHLDAFKLGYENSLTASGVTLLYNIQLAGLSRENGIWTGLFGTKGGLQSIRAKYVIDCTENNILAVFLPAEQLEHVCPPALETDRVYRTIEFTGVSEPLPPDVHLPEAFSNRVGSTVKMHRGAFSRNHVFVEIPMILKGSGHRSLKNDMRVEWEARKLSLEVCEYLVSSVQAFQGAQICLASGMVMRRTPFDPLEYLDTADVLMEDCIKQGFTVEKCFCIGSRPQSTIDSEQIPNEFPLLGNTDICVVGGGPSGASAAFAAAQEGASVILLDFNDELGGAGTSGSVRWHWFGFRRGFTKTSDMRTEAWHKRLGWNKQYYMWGMDDEWAAEAKAMAFFELCVETNVDVYLGCFGVDAVMQGDKVTGVLVSTPYGGMHINCSVTIDATGDGDIAAFAGVPYQYGNGRDRITMWGALGPLITPSTYDGDYSTLVDTADVFDRTRFIMSARRRSGMAAGYFINTTMAIPDKAAESPNTELDGRPIDHAVYLAPRESRHIQGGYTMTLMDQLLQKRYRDTIMVAYSNNDPKGISMADIMNIGLLPPNLHIHVPYRCILPEGVEGLIVAGRALSCTHDANCAVRMQDDMQMLGGAAGVAAALCTANDVSPRNLNARMLQARLVELDAMDHEVIQEADTVPIDGVEAAVENLLSNEGLKWSEQSHHEYTREPLPVAIVCNAEPEDAVPVLIKACAVLPKSPARLLLSRLLVYHGSEEGLEDVLEQIQEDLAGGSLPLRDDKSNFCHILPDHNMMPETAYLLHGLAFCQSKRVIPAFEKLVDILCTNDRDYETNRKGTFYYVRVVAYSAERLGFPEFIPLLHRVLDLPEIRDLSRTDLVEPSIYAERFAYLALMLNMALARCGSKDGYLGLCTFLEGQCGLLQRSAYDELCALTGHDFGHKISEWNQFVLHFPEVMDSKPWTSKLV